jgi:hypothetical protein
MYLIEGFYYTIGKKRNRYGANVNERTSHLRIDWLIKNRHIGGHTIFNKRDTPQNTASPFSEILKKVLGKVAPC